MKVKSEKFLLACLLSLLIFSGCSSGGKFASSFGKRKYTKGYYTDVPSKIREVSKDKGQSPLITPIVKQQPILISEIRPSRVLGGGKNSSPLQVFIRKTPKSTANKPSPSTRDKRIASRMTKPTARISVLAGKQSILEIIPNKTDVADDITAAKDDNTVKYTDYGITSMFATILWIFLMCFLIVFKIPTGHGLGLAFLLAMIVLIVLAYIYSALGVKNPDDVHHGMAMVLFGIYSLITSGFLTILAFII